MMTKLLFIIALALVGLCTTASAQTCITGGPAVPAQAAARGYNCLVFYDPMTSLSTIDTTQTGIAAGKKWTWSPCWQNSEQQYGANGGYNCTSNVAYSPPSSLTSHINVVNHPSDCVSTASTSAITGWCINIPNTTNTNGNLLFSALSKASSPGYTGFAATGGFYYQVYEAWSGPGGGQYFGPYSHTVEGMLNPNPGGSNPATTKNIEIDFSDTFGSGNAFDHYTAQSTGLSGAVYATFGTPTFGVQGVLHVPPYDNDGTHGILEYDLNGTNIGQCTYATGVLTACPGASLSGSLSVGDFTELPGRHNVLIIQSGIGVPSFISGFAVWQKQPPAGGGGKRIIR